MKKVIAWEKWDADLIEQEIAEQLQIDEDDKDGDSLTVGSDAWEKDLALSLRFDINDFTPESMRVCN